MHWFITGTDTGVGKTYICHLLIKKVALSGCSISGFKPLCCGDREDLSRLQAASMADVSFDEMNPYWFKTPVSPMAAAWIENKSVDVAKIKEALDNLKCKVDNIIVEGAGGWEVPIKNNYSTADLAADIGYPIVVVVDNKLGALNHTILTVRNILARGLVCAGLIMNHTREEADIAAVTNKKILQEVLPVPLLAEVIYGDTDIEFIEGALTKASVDK